MTALINQSPDLN